MTQAQSRMDPEFLLLISLISACHVRQIGGK
jgi:hypothetical protein